MNRRGMAWPLGLVWCVLLTACVATAQPAAALTIKRGNTTVDKDSAWLALNILKLQRNDTVVVRQDGGNYMSHDVLLRIGSEQIFQDSIRKLQNRLDLLKDSVILQNRALVKEWYAIDTVQDRAFDSLYVLYDRQDSLLASSITNTENAVGAAKRIRWQGYITATLLGAVTGYVLVDNYWGALGGALGCFGLNVLIVGF